MFSYCPRRPQRGVATHRLRNAQQLEPLQTNGQLSPPHREPSPPDTHRALEQVDANTSTPPPGPRLPWAVRRLANSLRVASLLSPALSFGLSYIPPPPHSEPVVDGTFSQHRLPPPKDQSAGCGLPRPLSPLSPAPPPPPEFSDPLGLPGREEGEDKFLSVPEHRALCAQTQRGTGIRGVRGTRRALESSKSFVKGATWHGGMDADLGGVPALLRTPVGS